MDKKMCVVYAQGKKIEIPGAEKLILVVKQNNERIQASVNITKENINTFKRICNNII